MKPLCDFLVNKALNIIIARSKVSAVHLISINDIST